MTINTDMLQKVTHILRDYFAAEVQIDRVDFLSEPDRRNKVVRLFLHSTSSLTPQSIILKQSLPEESDSDDQDAYARYARDWAGLEFASIVQKNAHNVPRFYGGNQEYRMILIEDLGEQHISLVDSLTIRNPDKAISALSRFMTALGSFHATSYGCTEQYEAILRGINPHAETLQEDLNFVFSDVLSQLELAHKNLGLHLSPACIDEAKGLIESVLKPGPFTALTHGDICPDNVFDHEDHRDLQLIDFEWACVRSALLDGTYLRMSMPTCWCAKAIPVNIIESLECIYREELKRTIPLAADDLAYTTAYTEACGFWVLQQTLHFINSTIDGDRVGPSGPTPEDSLWKAEENWVRPRVLSRLQAFVDVATHYGQLPHLRQMAELMLVTLRIRWPDTKSLEYYPAFMD
ncbi:phosphotransferase family protein [Legionella anisa]|uniref:phosphotransferase family protein n=1 Tax=Legionella anisa TaxID=28082 RepID=UPI001040F9DD|nr:phosphotransferase [Legionella anisa]